MSVLWFYIQDTRSFVVHQLLVKVAGWQRIAIPISVDKIGVFFREVWPSSDSELDRLPELPRERGSTRLVFAISLSDTQKVVNVRSALVLHNTMELPLQVHVHKTQRDYINNCCIGILFVITYFIPNFSILQYIMS
jgi:hypothetical protein